MRIASALAFALLVCASPAQIWEKTIAPGLTYRMEYDSLLPRAIHSVRYSPASSAVRAVPELAEGNVYSDSDSKGRETISSMVARTGAIAGINADYFPFTGNPLGLMVREGELVSVPIRPRSAFGWGKEASQAGLVQWRISMQPEGMDPLALDGINDQCEPNMAILNGPTAGLALAKHPAICAVIKVDKWQVTPQGSLSGEVKHLMSEVTKVPVGPDTALVVGLGQKATYLAALRPGMKVKFTTEVIGLDWSRVQSAVGGGPFLVRDGKHHVDWQEQGFQPELSNKRHPRTAVGRSKDGDIWFVAVDGRQAASVGATLDELAAIMLRLGCEDAINLDGGGSTALNLFGLPVNRPTDGVREAERKVANGVLFYADSPAVASEALTVSAPDKATMGQPVDLVVKTEKGEVLPNVEVIWAATGSGYIDQGGRLYPLKAGNVNVAAHVRGQLIAATVTVEAPVLPEPESTSPPTTDGKPPSRTAKAQRARRQGVRTQARG